MGLIARHKLISISAGTAVVAVVCFGFSLFSNFGRAEAENSKWKSFSEKNYGFSTEYPGSWSFEVGYDRYAPGLINAEITNKKCGSFSKSCNADCVDLRILSGKNPQGTATSALFIQLYENFQAVKSSHNAEMVNKMDLGGKTVYKVMSSAPTLSLNGACGGPLYIFETDAGYFAYVFAGLGERAAANEEAVVEKIISSIKVNGKQ
ncbi:MAG: hypothetical protein MUD10_05600 [Candidatus Pacebacteria bacterium]|nr:hypothetical protein [Candidatus Paceibacterota bacterium]